MELLKEAIRRVVWVFGSLGFVPEQIVATNGTLKYRFLDWLYGEPIPLFDTQWPD